MHNKRSILAVLTTVGILLVLLLAPNCNRNSKADRENRDPVVTQGVSANIPAPQTGQTVIFSITATDPDGDAMTFTWVDSSVDNGSFSGQDDTVNGSTVNWVTTTEGTYQIMCDVKDTEDNVTRSSMTINVSGATAAVFTGAERCETCHSGVFAQWEGTIHPEAWTNLNAAGNGDNPNCLPCHTVGYGMGGYVDQATTSGLGGVQCESCHGASGDHPSSGNLPVPWDPTGACAACHIGSHHPTATEWATSAHATGEGSGNYRTRGGSCYRCHNGEGFVSVTVDGEEPVDEVEGDGTGIVCATCHDPHGSPLNAWLRTVDPVALPDGTIVDGGTGNLCINCHGGRRTPEDMEGHLSEGSGHFGPHHNAQGKMLYGNGGVEWDGMDWPDSNGHAEIVSDSCVSCHMFGEEYIDEDHPAVTGHGFHAEIDSCTSCHGELTSFDLGGTQTEIAALGATLWDLLPKDAEDELDTDPATTTRLEREAAWNYLLVMVDDGSMGVHNPAYARALLSNSILQMGGSVSLYRGADACGACHGAIYDQWDGTIHPEAWVNLDAAGNGDNPACLPCHTVGFDMGGYIDQTETPELGGVQCENCHGAGGHAQGIDWSPEGNCGSCHIGSHHPTGTEWLESGHATGEGSGNYRTRGGSCYRCHNGEGFVSVTVDGEEPVDEVVGDGVGIVCATCHDPHGSANYKWLRAIDPVEIPTGTIVDGGLGNLCINCHGGRRTVEDMEDHLTNGSGHFGPHHNAQGKMLYGFGGVEFDGYEYPNGGHATVVDDSCIGCHMFGEEYIDEDHPAVTGHSFAANMDSCDECHREVTNFDYGGVQTEIADLGAVLWDLLPKDAEDELDTDPATTTRLQREAAWNYLLVTVDDGSMGVHNAPYARALLNSSIEMLEGQSVLFRSAEGCDSCHNEIYNQWSASIHPEAWVNLDAAGNGDNPACLPCHTVGFGEGGYVDQATTPELAGVQCENCHGAEGHVVGVDWTPEGNCGSCHVGSHHPTGTEWLESAHATGEGSGNYRTRGGSCYRCHNGEGFVSVTIDGEEPVDEVEGDGVGIVCGTCHDPHGNANDHYLRTYEPTTLATGEAVDGGFGNLCLECHGGRRTAEDMEAHLSEGSGHFGPHHNAQGKLLYGVGGVEFDGYEYSSSAHAEVVPDACVGCHMWGEEYIDEDHPAVTGHSFNANEDACDSCHREVMSFDYGGVQTEIADLGAILWDLLPKDAEDELDTDVATTTRLQREAAWNYLLVIEDDGSMGMHNPQYSKDLLISSIEMLEGAASPFRGADGCMTCHNDIYLQWGDTIHPDAWVNLDAAGNGDNPACLPCHTVGFGEGGYVDEATTAHLGGVQCENCHGAQGHEQGIDWSPEGNCGSCHVGSHHPTGTEWLTSAHATGEGSGNYRTRGGSCYRCHNGEGFVSVTIDGEEPVDEVEGDGTGIVCATCHDPHGDPNYKWLRTVDPTMLSTGEAVDGGLGNLCLECHGGRRTLEDMEDHLSEGSGHFGPHHNAQGKLYYGVGGVEFDGYDYPSTTHKDFLQDACVSCHMYGEEYIDEDHPAVTGHGFHPELEACEPCHGVQPDFNIGNIQAEIAELAATLWDMLPKDAEDEIDSDPATTTRLEREAAWNYLLVVEDDGSMGVHNAAYARALLISSIEELGGEIPLFRSAAACESCHTSEFDQWNGTDHPGAFDTLDGIGQGENETCLPCHTVGFGEGGYVDQATTPQLGGVQCENCHGSALTHPAEGPPANGVDWDPASNCGSCHVGSHHPTGVEWLTSAHAQMDTAPGSYSTRTGSCWGCHNGEGFVAVKINGEEPITEAPEVGTAVVCATCHDPHGSPNDHWLRTIDPVTLPTGDVVNADLGNTCVECHGGRRTPEDMEDHLTNGSNHFGPHHNAQGKLFYGVGGVEFDGYDYTSNHTHQFVANDCVGCHMYGEEYIDEDHPAVTGHSFEPEVEACNCHGDIPNFDYDGGQTYIQGLLDQLYALLPKDLEGEIDTDPATTTRTEREAAWNYLLIVDDGSLGVHNPNYAEDVLLSAIAELD